MVKMLGLLATAVAIQLACSVLAEPVQYCRYGHSSGSVDFCMGITNHYNQSVDAYDLYLSFSVTQKSAAGWTAIGTGPTMQGALMFVVYGDPVSGQKPVLSIRTASGHTQPLPITPQDSGHTEVRILQSHWVEQERTTHSPQAGQSQPEVYQSRHALVCYSCSRWTGSKIMPQSTSQPWIWAWNDKQELGDYDVAAHLDMHQHHAGAGGWGNFYVDMARSVSVSAAAIYPSLPPLRTGVTLLGTSDMPLTTSGFVAAIKARSLAYLHGFCMALSFLLLFPLGVIAMRFKSTNAFRNHWVIQVVASITVMVGAVTGLVLQQRRESATSHQWLGGTITLLLFIQPVLGWKHHINFLSAHSRSLVSYAHIWLGRCIMAGGWVNVVLGLRLSGVQQQVLIIGVVLVLVEAGGLSIHSCISNFRSRQKATDSCIEVGAPNSSRMHDTNKYFAVALEGDIESDDDTLTDEK